MNSGSIRAALGALRGDVRPTCIAITSSYNEYPPHPLITNIPHNRACTLGSCFLLGAQGCQLLVKRIEKYQRLDRNPGPPFWRHPPCQMRRQPRRAVASLSSVLYRSQIFNLLKLSYRSVCASLRKAWSLLCCVKEMLPRGSLVAQGTA